MPYGKQVMDLEVQKFVELDHAGAAVAGAQNVPGHRKDSFHATFNSANATTAATVQGSVAGSSIFVTDVTVSVETSVSIQLLDNAGTPGTVVPPLYMPGTSIWSKTYSTPRKLTSAKSLMVKTSGTTNISVMAEGYYQ